MYHSVEILDFFSAVWGSRDTWNCFVSTIDNSIIGLDTNTVTLGASIFSQDEYNVSDKIGEIIFVQ